MIVQRVIFFSGSFSRTKGWKVMRKGKRIARGVIAATLMLSVLGSTASVANAKTYYSMKYGKWNTGKPWKASSRKAYENDVRAGLGISTFNSRLSETKRYDCDGDGKIETIKLYFDYNKCCQNFEGILSVILRCA